MKVFQILSMKIFIIMENCDEILMFFNPKFASYEF